MEGVWKLGVLRFSLLLRVFKRLTNDEIHVVVVRITATKSKQNFVSRTKQDSRNEEVANCYSCAILEPPVYYSLLAFGTLANYFKNESIKFS
jgi:hypothetical protein